VWKRVRRSSQCTIMLYNIVYTYTPKFRGNEPCPAANIYVSIYKCMIYNIHSYGRYWYTIKYGRRLFIFPFRFPRCRTTCRGRSDVSRDYVRRQRSGLYIQPHENPKGRPPPLLLRSIYIYIYCTLSVPLCFGQGRVSNIV